MLKAIKFKFFNYLFRDVLSADLINKLLHEERINNCNKSTIKDQSSRFYEEARVLNLADDPSKILIGKNTHIRGDLVVFPSGGIIRIGSNCFIGENSRIWSQDGIEIKDNVLISHNVNIHDTNSHPINYLDRREDFKKIISSGFDSIKRNIITKPITINDDAWIGFNSIILKGVTIGRAAIVAAGSVVISDVEDFTIVAGNPAKTIKKIL